MEHGTLETAGGQVNHHFGTFDLSIIDDNKADNNHVVELPNQ